MISGDYIYPVVLRCRVGYNLYRMLWNRLTVGLRYRSIEQPLVLSRCSSRNSLLQGRSDRSLFRFPGCTGTNIRPCNTQPAHPFCLGLPACAPFVFRIPSLPRAPLLATQRFAGLRQHDRSHPASPSTLKHIARGFVFCPGYGARGPCSLACQGVQQSSRCASEAWRLLAWFLAGLDWTGMDYDCSDKYLDLLGRCQSASHLDYSSIALVLIAAGSVGLLLIFPIRLLHDSPSHDCTTASYCPPIARCLIPHVDHEGARSSQRRRV